MHYLITGHTGFKGSWLALMLKNQGHDVSGISLNPVTQSLFYQAELSKIFLNDIRLDIREKENLTKIISVINPDVIIHLAAQPLVRYSYKAPIETFEVNVIGTLNVLESTRLLPDLKHVLIVTTDKVYKNTGKMGGYTEEDPLGGSDPYSTSKAAADLATQSWIKSFSACPISIVRAGNVIGGGDWAQDRLIPDLVSAIKAGNQIELRYPNSVRPWQHVLDCLNGYLKVISIGIERQQGGIWNISPEPCEIHSVKEVATSFLAEWEFDSDDTNIIVQSQATLPEAALLLLDSSKARQEIEWGEKLPYSAMIAWTVEWYKNDLGLNPMAMCMYQIEKYSKLPS
jgi:CDP-glucose 4,6-dehydratase